MKFNSIAIFILVAPLFSCSNENSQTEQKDTTPTFQNKGHELVFNSVQKMGDYKALSERKDVVYTYTYQTPDGKADISTEKYIFKNELSYGSYHQHERTFPDLNGTIEQGYDGSEYWLKHDNKYLEDSTRLKRVAFNRPTNFYWFAMMQKLLDSGLNYEYLGEQKLNNSKYDIVKVTFNSMGEKPTDIYQLYINKETLLIDQFLFTVADFGVMETPFLMTLEYENIDGIWVPSKRLYKKSTWDAAVSEDPWIEVTWSNITFNNGLNTSDFKKV
jgi:hypothetical protein